MFLWLASRISSKYQLELNKNHLIIIWFKSIFMRKRSSVSTLCWTKLTYSWREAESSFKQTTCSRLKFLNCEKFFEIASFHRYICCQNTKRIESGGELIYNTEKTYNSRRVKVLPRVFQQISPKLNRFYAIEQ